MTRQFNVGDRVRVNCPGGPHHGAETVITGGLAKRLCRGSLTGRLCEDWAYRVDLMPSRSDCEYMSYQPRHLDPIYDGNEKVSWSSCEWMPKGVRA